jgi:hypothetical protein
LNFEILARPSSVYHQVYQATMASSDDNWSIATPPRIFSPKRQKTEPEITIKVQYEVKPGSSAHLPHVFLMQTIMTAMGNDIKILNKRGEILKESVIPALSDMMVYSNHYTSNTKTNKTNSNVSIKAIVIHRIRGIHKVSHLKKDPKIMDFLQAHKVQVHQHDWKEDEWDLKMLGFFTTIYPSTMPNEYATKIVSTYLKNPVKKQKTPLFRLRQIPISLTTGEGRLTTRAYSIEVKSSDIKTMTTLLMDNLTPGTFIPFRMRSVNVEAYNKAIKFIASKSENIWTILIKYISDGAFFKLEQPIKHTLSVEHIIHDPKTKTARILVTKKDFSNHRKLLKEKMATWVNDLDPDDIKEHNTPPEVAHIAKDDYSSSDETFYSHSINTIMTFEVEEISFQKDETSKPSEVTTNTTPSEISFPQTLHASAPDTELEKLKAQVTQYQKELANYASKMERMYNMLETLFDKFKDAGDNKNNSEESLKSNRRP